MNVRPTWKWSTLLESRGSPASMPPHETPNAAPGPGEPAFPLLACSRERSRLATAEDLGFRRRRPELETFGNVRLLSGEEPPGQSPRGFFQGPRRAGVADRLPQGQA